MLENTPTEELNTPDIKSPFQGEYKIKLTAHDVNAVLTGEGFPVNKWLIRVGWVYDEVADVSNTDGIETLPEENFDFLVLSQLNTQSNLIFPINRRGDTDKFLKNILRRAIMIIDQSLEQDLSGLKLSVGEVKNTVWEIKLSDKADFNTIARLLWIIELVRRRERVYQQKN